MAVYGGTEYFTAPPLFFTFCPSPRHSNPPVRNTNLFLILPIFLILLIFPILLIFLILLILMLIPLFLFLVLIECRLTCPAFFLSPACPSNAAIVGTGVIVGW